MFVRNIQYSFTMCQPVDLSTINQVFSTIICWEKCWISCINQGHRSWMNITSICWARWMVFHVWFGTVHSTLCPQDTAFDCFWPFFIFPFSFSTLSFFFRISLNYMEKKLRLLNFSLFFLLYGAKIFMNYRFK